MPYSNVSRRKVTHFNEGEKEERESENGRRKRKEKVVEREREIDLSLSISSEAAFQLPARCASSTLCHPEKIIVIFAKRSLSCFRPPPTRGISAADSQQFCFRALCPVFVRLLRLRQCHLTIGKRAILPPSQPPTRWDTDPRKETNWIFVLRYYDLQAWIQHARLRPGVDEANYFDPSLTGRWYDHNSSPYRPVSGQRMMMMLIAQRKGWYDHNPPTDGYWSGTRIFWRRTVNRCWSQ